MLCDESLSCDNQRQIAAKVDGSCCPKCSELSLQGRTFEVLVGIMILSICDAFL